MIITQTVTIGDSELTYTYSDAGRYVVRDGISYVDAYDPAELNRTYTEGDEIPAEESNTTAEEILQILLGDENT